MARLGLDINLALQRLLGANKERAAANRGELEDRKLRKENAAEKAQLAADAPRPGSPTQDEEIRGGTPKLYRAPEPAAQRRKKKGLQVFGVSRLAARPEFGSEINYSASWTRTVANFRYRVSFPQGFNRPGFYEFITPPTYNSNTETNYYSKQTTEWGPEFNQELSNSRRLWIAPKHSVQDRITDFKWTYRQEANVFFADGFQVEASIPLPPFRLDEIVSARTSDAYVSSDGTYIYVTHIAGVFTPGITTTSGTVYGVDTAENPNPLWIGNRNETDAQYIIDGGTGYYYRTVTTGENFFTKTFEQVTNRFSTPGYDTYGLLGPGTMQGMPEAGSRQHTIDRWYGLYWRFNVRNPTTPELRVEQIYLTVSDNAFSNTGGAASRALFETMYPSDPIYRLFQAQAAGYTGLPTSLLIDQFLNNNDGFYKRWPPGLVYDEQRGYLTFVTTLAGWDTPRMFTKQVGQITYGYAGIPIIELPDNFNRFLTTEQEMLNAGWVNEGLIPQNTLNPLEQYFAFKP